MLTSQTQSLRGIGQRVRYPLLQPLSRPFDHDRRFYGPLRNIRTRIKNKTIYARQSARDGRYVALRSEVTPKNILIAYIVFSLIPWVAYCVYEPLRDHGVFNDIADSTVFRMIPPKLVKAADGADETIYQPLTQEDEIRLLVLEPGVPSDKLKCHLIHAELSWRTRYEALSYVWGDGTVTCPLSCSGRTEIIYVNLHDALSDLRLPDRERILWTDRLCINQSDNEEKATQIRLMGKIYSQASRVLIYLGRIDPSVEGAMESIRRVDWEFTAFSSVWNPVWLTYKIWSLFKNADIKDEINWDPIVNLLRRPWFQRTWVFQEAVLAKHGQVVCGDQSIPWTVFERSVKAIPNLKTSLQDIPAFHPMDKSIVSGISLMASARSIRRTTFLQHVWLYGPPRPGSPPYDQDSLKLLDLIMGSRSFSCTRPEDKIFGMLGVTSQDTESEYLKADSSLPPEDVFRKFVLWEILHNDSLRVLGSSSEKARSQPSWVPDFERLDPQSSLTGTKNCVRFNASKGLPTQVWVSNKETVLHVKGRIIDTLHTIGRELTTIPDTFAGENALVYSNYKSLSHLGLNKHMIEEARDIWLAATERLTHCPDPVIMAGVKKGTLAATRADGKISWAPFLRTLVCNRTADGEVPLRDFILGNVASFVRQTLEVDVVPEYLMQKDRSEAIYGLRAFLSLTESRRFAATDIGLAGYVPMRAKEGDLVCILYGSDVPFVVRKQAGGRYALVGECYMHGIMSGEGLEMAVSKREDEVFTFI